MRLTAALIAYAPLLLLVIVGYSFAWLAGYDWLYRRFHWAPLLHPFLSFWIPELLALVIAAVTYRLLVTRFTASGGARAFAIVVLGIASAGAPLLAVPVTMFVGCALLHACI